MSKLLPSLVSSLARAGAALSALAEMAIAGHRSADGVNTVAVIGDSDGCGEFCENGTWKLLR